MVAFLRTGSSAGCEIRPRLRHTGGEPLNVNCAKMKRRWSRLTRHGISRSVTRRDKNRASTRRSNGSQHPSSADAHAPPVTQILADFVTQASVAGLGCERRRGGASDLAELGRLRDRRIATLDRRSGARRSAWNSRQRPRRPILGRARARRHRERGAAERHHVAHLRLRRHAPEDHHPSRRAGRLGAAGARRAPRRERARS